MKQRKLCKCRCGYIFHIGMVVQVCRSKFCFFLSSLYILTCCVSSSDPVAVCTPEGCRSKGNRYRVINSSSDLTSVVMVRDPKEASQQRKFRCRPFVTEDAFRAESCAVLTSLTSPITKNGKHLSVKSIFFNDHFLF